MAKSRQRKEPPSPATPPLSDVLDVSVCVINGLISARFNVRAGRAQTFRLSKAVAQKAGRKLYLASECA